MCSTFRILPVAMFAGLLLGGMAGQPAAAQPTDDSDRYIVIDGFAVHGYADGRELGYDWYKTKPEADQAKRQMEAAETTNGKYYDKVEIQPEQRRLYIPPPERPPVPEPTLPPAGPRPGVRSMQTPPSGGGVSLQGTTWTGSESASDTTSLKFVFNAGGTVVAYDDTRTVWRGTWRIIAGNTVVIQLTSPHAVNYSGQIRGAQMSGQAGRPDGRGQWTWSVRQR